MRRASFGWKRCLYQTQEGAAALARPMLVTALMVLGSSMRNHSLIGVSYPLKATELNQGSGLLPAAALRFVEFSSRTRASCWMCFVFLLQKFSTVHLFDLDHLYVLRSSKNQAKKSCREVILECRILNSDILIRVF